MQKTLLSFIITIFCCSANAQTNTFPLTGKVGIGTISPMQNFVVSENGKEGFEVYLNQPAGAVGLQAYNRILNAYSKMILEASNFSFIRGNVGIGTIADPLQKFVVSNEGMEGLEVYFNQPNGAVGLQTYNRTSNAYSKMILEASNFSFTKGNVGIGTIADPLQKFVISNEGMEGLEVYFSQPNGDVGLQTYNRTSNAYSKMVLEASNFAFIRGNVGIGTSDTRGYKFTVAGSILSESVTVKLQNAWPDYVFKSDYKLPSLKEIEVFIKKNQHLPQMPSAIEVKRDGLDMGQMSISLTRKIEELTLYMIDLKKDNERLSRENEKLKRAQQLINKKLNKIVPEK